MGIHYLEDATHKVKQGQLSLQKVLQPLRKERVNGIFHHKRIPAIKVKADF